MLTQYSDRFREWSILSTETKPTAGVRPGDELVEINTSKRYKWDATNTTWVELIPKVQMETGDFEIGAVEIKNSTDDTRATVGANGLYVDSQNRTVAVTFQSAATSTGNGTAFEVGAYRTLTVKITGTSSTRTVTFYAKDTDGNLTALMGVRLSDFATGTSTTGTGEYWQFDITGIYSIVMDLTAVAGGNVSVKGRAVA